ARPDTGPGPAGRATPDSATPSTPGPTTPSPSAAAPPIYPLSLRLEGRRAVVVGGGSVALRRVAPALADMAGRGQITAHERGYQPGDLDGAWLVLACTDRAEVNEAVAAD